MRDLVARIHDEDGTGDELRGSDEFTSTRKLTDRQFDKLLALVESRSKPSRRRAELGNIVWMASDQERAYVKYMANGLGWGLAELERFILRQTKGKGIRTHRQATAVITPMERLMLERGFLCDEQPDGRKWWHRDGKPLPQAEEVPF